MWFILALLSAVFAACTSILAKIGIEGVDSHLATAIRTMVVVCMAWGMVFLTDAQKGLAGLCADRGRDAFGGFVMSGKEPVCGNAFL